MSEHNRSYTYPVLFLYLSKNQNISYSRKSAFLILLLLAGDIEVCPGPTGPGAGPRPGPDHNHMSCFAKSKGLKIMHQNIRGLWNQKDNLEVILNQYKSFDIFTLSETHIAQNHPLDNNDLYNLDGYKFVKRNRSTGEGGGVAIYVSDRLNFVRKENLESETMECIWIEIILKKAKNILIGVLYRPPDSSLHCNKNFNEDLDSMLSLVHDTSFETIILGDINVNYLIKKDHKNIKDIFKIHGYQQIIETPTRTTDSSSTLIDAIFTNHPQNISNQNVFPLSLSDHDCVGCTRKLNNEHFDPKTIICRNYNSYNETILCDKLKQQNWSYFKNCECPNKAWQIMKTNLLKVFNEIAPLIQKRIKGRFCHWLTHEIKTLMNQRDKLRRKARKSKAEEDWNLYKKKKNSCTNLVKRTKDRYHQEELFENKNNPSKFWDNIKKVFPNKNGNSSITYAPKINGSENTPKAKADSFCNFFANAAENLKRDSYPLMNFKWKPRDKIFCRTRTTFKFKHVNNAYISKELSALKVKKAAGIDDLPAKLLKDSAKVISGPLCKLINRSLETGVVPSEWKIAKINPLHKKGDVTLANNYRPISVLPILSKVLEKVVHNQLTDYLEENKLLCPRQFGFRKKHSTELATSLLIDDMRKEVDCGKLVGVVFIDLSKAFDTLDHALLLDKIASYGIASNEIEWFTDYLFGRKQICIYEGGKSNAEPLNIGVPQGSILGPVLFLLYFNDFIRCLKHTKVVQFADDTVIYTSSKDFSAVESMLNSDLISISEYFERNQLIINLNKGKTEAMLVGTAKRLFQCGEELNLIYNTSKILTTDQYKYLGSKINPTLNMNDHFQTVYKQTCSKLCILSKLKTRLTTDSLKAVYDSMIIPSILYSSVNNLSLSKTQVDQLNSIQRRAEKILNQKVENISNLINMHSVLLVKKCIENMVSDEFKNYFEIRTHSAATRNNGYLLQIPKVKLQFAKAGFFSMGVKSFNSLPIEIRQANSYLDFRNLTKDYFTSKL